MRTPSGFYGMLFLLLAAVVSGCGGGGSGGGSIAASTPAPTVTPTIQNSGSANGFAYLGIGTVNSTGNYASINPSPCSFVTGNDIWEAITFTIYSAATPAPTPTPNPQGTYFVYVGTYSLNNGDAGQMLAEDQQALSTPAPAVFLGGSNNYMNNNTSTATYVNGGCLTASMTFAGNGGSGTMSLDSGASGTITFTSKLAQSSTHLPASIFRNTAALKLLRAIR